MNRRRFVETERNWTQSVGHYPAVYQRLIEANQAAGQGRSL